MPPYRYPLNLPSYPGMDTNDQATAQEQAEAFINADREGTGINPHSYTGVGAGVFANDVRNPGGLVIAPSQSNSGSEVQQVRLVSGQVAFVSKPGNAVTSENELVTGGFGMSPNVLLNLPDSDGSYRGRPIWNYSAIERIDALPAYQAQRVRLLDTLANLVESDEYDFFIVAIPANAADATIAWKDSFRAQVSVPPESFLVMIAASAS